MGGVIRHFQGRIATGSHLEGTNYTLPMAVGKGISKDNHASGWCGKKGGHSTNPATGNRERVGP